MLVQPNANISENAGEVATSHTEVDEDTERRLGQRAQTVADRLKQYTELVTPTAATTPIAEHTQTRLTQRQQQMAQFTTQQTHAAAPTYPAANADTPVLDQRERIALRVKANQALRDETADANVASSLAAKNPTSVDLTSLVQAVEKNAAITDELTGTHAAAPEEKLHSGAPLADAVPAPPKAKRLTSSGAKENFMLLMALAACAGAALSNPLRRQRLIALLAPRQ
jgi:hypothetical protein